jgi:DNA polymerase III subunit delta
MAEIPYNELAAFLDKNGAGALAPAILIFGEELLCKKALGSVLDRLVTAAERAHCYHPMDGADADLGEALERVNTYSLLGGRKIVAILDSRVFQSRNDAATILEKARDAHGRDQMKKAARSLLGLLAVCRFSLEDLDTEDGRRKLPGCTGRSDAELAWISQVVDFCRSRNLSVPAHGSGIQQLEAAVEKGFPPENHLVITSDNADKRRKLFGMLRDRGLVIDCSVPKGDRKADRETQAAFLRAQARSVLTPLGKGMDPDAFAAVTTMTGFDLRTFTNNLEKLVNYVGDRDRITLADVKAVLRRTKKDPIYELTNAVSDRQPERALVFLDSLLADNFHPLQILAALINQIRRLMVAKGFAESDAGRSWQADCPYPRFKSQVMPAILRTDAELVELLQEWEPRLAPDPGDDRGKRRKKKPAKPKTDLILAKNPKSPYPVFQTLKKSSRFTGSGLEAAQAALSRCDRRLKGSGQDPRIALEKVILDICR